MEKSERNIVFLIMAMGMAIICILLYLTAFGNVIDSIMYKNWYWYNSLTGTYEKIYFEKEKMTYSTDNKEFDSCSKYKYNKNNYTISMDCNIDLKIEHSNDSCLIIKYKNNEKKFFTTTEETVNNEFKEYYSMSMTEYTDKNGFIKDLKKIKVEEIESLLKDEKKSIILLSGDNCNNVTCVTILSSLEKWISKSEDVYYFDSTDIKESDALKLNEVDKKFYKKPSEYNSSYPLVFIVGNNKLHKVETLNCKGLDCEKYDEYYKLLTK